MLTDPRTVELRIMVSEDLAQKLVPGQVMVLTFGGRSGLAHVRTRKRLRDRIARLTARVSL